MTSTYHLLLLVCALAHITLGVAQSSLLTADMNIDNTMYRFTFLPTIESIKSVVSEFCINNQEALGIAPLTEETLPDCHNPIANRLREFAVRQAEESQLLETDITVDNVPYRFTFHPTIESIKSVASEFCINNQEALGIAPLTEETLPACHNPIAARLRDVAILRAEESQLLEMDINVGDVPYRFRFYPTVDSIKSVASEFCVNNQEALGIAPLTEETLPDCHNPIANRLRDAAVQHLSRSSSTESEEVKKSEEELSTPETDGPTQPNAKVEESDSTTVETAVTANVTPDEEVAVTETITESLEVNEASSVTDTSTESSTQTLESADTKQQEEEESVPETTTPLETAEDSTEISVVEDEVLDTA